MQRDLDEAWRWYEEASPGLGDEFFDEFLSLIEGIRMQSAAVGIHHSWPPDGVV